ncbi:MAG: sulfite exporter TauE/SafE family protein [Pseudomonadota bacterium]
MEALAGNIVLALVGAAVGVLIGTVGVGGVLLVSFLALFGGLSIHQAAATALFTFAFTGVLGTWLYERRGSIDWRITVPVCAGSLVFGYLGATAAARIDARPLAAIIALVIIAAGAYIIVPQRGAVRHRDGRGWREQALLVSVGAASGFGSGFSGAGGPLFSVPIMVVLRYLPLTAVATSQVLQIVAAISGSIGNLRHGFIDFRVAAVVAVFELAGLLLGVRLAHAASAAALRRLAGALCVVTGAILLYRTL